MLSLVREFLVRFREHLARAGGKSDSRRGRIGALDDVTTLDLGVGNGLCWTIDARKCGIDLFEMRLPLIARSFAEQLLEFGADSRPDVWVGGSVVLYQVIFSWVLSAFSESGRFNVRWPTPVSASNSTLVVSNSVGIRSVFVD